MRIALWCLCLLACAPLARGDYFPVRVGYEITGGPEWPEDYYMWVFMAVNGDPEHQQEVEVFTLSNFLGRSNLVLDVAPGTTTVTLWAEYGRPYDVDLDPEEPEDGFTLLGTLPARVLYPGDVCIFQLDLGQDYERPEGDVRPLPTGTPEEMAGGDDEVSARVKHDGLEVKFVGVRELAPTKGLPDVQRFAYGLRLQHDSKAEEKEHIPAPHFSSSMAGVTVEHFANSQEFLEIRLPEDVVWNDQRGLGRLITERTVQSNDEGGPSWEKGDIKIDRAGTISDDAFSEYKEEISILDHDDTEEDGDDRWNHMEIRYRYHFQPLTEGITISMSNDPASAAWGEFRIGQDGKYSMHGAGGVAPGVGSEVTGSGDGDGEEGQQTPLEKGRDKFLRELGLKNLKKSWSDDLDGQTLAPVLTVTMMEGFGAGIPLVIDFAQEPWATLCGYIRGLCLGLVILSAIVAWVKLFRSLVNLS